MRLGLYGGTFDPAHLGHLIMAEQARVELGLRRVFFVLSPNPPHKPQMTVSPAAHRLKMLELSLAGHPEFEVSTVELERHGVSYTVDTLRHFRALPEFAGAEFFLLIGADSFWEFQNWREPEAIVAMAKLAVYPRPHLDRPEAASKFWPATCFLHGPLIDISSSDIRQRCSRGVSIRYLVPEKVRNYILEKKLYVNE